MFPDRYFAAHYFAPRYWPGGSTASPTTTVAIIPLRLAYSYDLETTMAFVDVVAVRLIYEDGTKISLDDSDAFAMQLTFDPRELLTMTSVDVISIWMSDQQ